MTISPRSSGASATSRRSLIFTRTSPAGSICNWWDACATYRAASWNPRWTSSCGSSRSGTTATRRSPPIRRACAISRPGHQLRIGHAGDSGDERSRPEGKRHAWFPLAIVAVFSGANGYQPVATDPNYVAAGLPNRPLGAGVGIPPICCPDISKGRIPLPLYNEMGYPVANRQMERGYIQSWNFIVERRLLGELVTSVGYVGTASANGFAFLDVNASQIPGSGNAGRPLFAKFGRTATTREWNGRTHSSYHSLQATINRRLAGGLFLKGAYTYSHAIDMANYSDWTAFRRSKGWAWSLTMAPGSIPVHMRGPRASGSAMWAGTPGVDPVW